jgi:hypothetical protein
MGIGNATQYLAWCGWGVRIPPDWRPLHIEGTWDKGAMMVGPGDEAVFQIKWQRPNPRRFDEQVWIRDRLARYAAFSHPGAAPGADGFSVKALFRDVPTRNAGNRSLWYGYSPAANLAVEVAVNRASAAANQRTALDETIPAASATSLQEATKWALYEVGFLSPAGYRITRWRLFSGDIALRLRGPAGKRLTVRQVYPAEIALTRRRMEEWLAAMPFDEHRRLRPSGPVESASVETRSGVLQGLKRMGRKRLAFPLGWVRSLHSVAVAVRDPGLDRLLIAESDTPEPVGDTPVSEAIRKMNWNWGGGSCV